jgi:hypothetical protein
MTITPEIADVLRDTAPEEKCEVVRGFVVTQRQP